MLYLQFSMWQLHSWKLCSLVLLVELTKAHDSTKEVLRVVDRPVVDLPAGRFRADLVRFDGGRGDSFLRLQGIQYAQHPVGKLRWQPPQPLGAESMDRSTIYDAGSFGADCINAPWYDRLLGIGLAKMKEECLFLNVWAPNASRGAPLPVMFWIHGGSFVSGGSSVYGGDGIMELRRDVVLVTANYRLGALGFLGGAAVGRSSSDGSSGNFGLQDTREALRWVQVNIGALGGDRHRVTIFGESSGSSFVALHLVAPKSAGLFAAAIMQSGAFDNYTMQADPEAGFKRFAKLAACDDRGDDDHVLDCLRSRPIDALFRKSLLPAIASTNNDAYFSPAVDHIEFNATPEVLAAKGQVNAVKGVILGSNQNEGRLLMPIQMPVPGAPLTTKAQFRAWLLSQFSESVTEEVLKRYPARNPLGRLSNQSYWRAAARVFTDSQYKCPTRRSARWLISSGAVPPSRVYTYELRYEASVYGLIGDALYWYDWCRYLSLCHNATRYPIGVGHAADVILLWNFPHTLITPNDHVMAQQVVDWWQNFATSYSPNELRSTTQLWPSFNEGNETLLLEPHSEPTKLRQNCDFWDRVHPVPYEHQHKRRPIYV